MPNQWFENFFSGVVTDFWRQCVSPEQTRVEADFLEKMLVCHPGTRLLDVPCGNGRHSLELAARGYAMSGLDISAEFILEARATTAHTGRTIEWICDDMRELNRTAAFDGAFSFGNSFGYLEHEDTERFLHALGRALKPNARFVLQTGSVAECLLPRFCEKEWHQVADILFLEENKYEFETSCVATEYTFVRDGKIEKRPGRQCIYTVAEIRRMLDRAGMDPRAIYGSLDEQPFKLANPILYVVAQKRS